MAKQKDKKDKSALGQKQSSRGLDFSRLPFLDNDGLSYLPKMQYFDFDEDCPMKPINKLEPDQALTVIIHSADGSIKCLAIPLEAVYEDDQE